MRSPSSGQPRIHLSQLGSERRWRLCCHPHQRARPSSRPASSLPRPHCCRPRHRLVWSHTAWDARDTALIARRSPFNDSLISSASDDGKVGIWKVPENFTLWTDADEPADVAPVAKLSGHMRYHLALQSAFASNTAVGRLATSSSTPPPRTSSLVHLATTP